MNTTPHHTGNRSQVPVVAKMCFFRPVQCVLCRLVDMSKKTEVRSRFLITAQNRPCSTTVCNCQDMLDIVLLRPSDWEYWRWLAAEE